MSNTIQPNNQWPTPCDFGPFLGGYCGKVVSIDFRQAQSNISVADLTLELFETATATINLNDLVVSLQPIDWTKTTFGTINGGVLNYDKTTQTITFKPDETPSVDRVSAFSFQVTDTLGFQASGSITINIVDKTPVLTVKNVTLSGTEAQVYTINVADQVTATNTTVSYTQSDSVTISSQPTEGTVTVANGVITYTPSQVPAINRTVTFKFLVKCLAGLTAESTVSIALTDITPVLTSSNITKSLVDNTTLTGSILGSISIKNDTFKTLTFGTPSEGTIVVSGSNYTYTPNSALSTSRTITIPYTVTTVSGLTSTSNLVINITDYNIWANYFWYGNSTLDILTQAEIEKSLSFKSQSAYAGTYAMTAGSGVYKWFVYPKAWGITPTIVDAATLFEFATNDYQYITINGIDLVCIRSYYQVNGAINVKFS